MNREIWLAVLREEADGLIDVNFDEIAKYT